MSSLSVYNFRLLKLSPVTALQNASDIQSVIYERLSKYGRKLWENNCANSSFSFLHVNVRVEHGSINIFINSSSVVFALFGSPCSIRMAFGISGISNATM